MDNYAIADQFSLLAKLMDIHGENAFKAKSYAATAFALEKMPQEIASLPREKIISTKGIGESAGKKIIELLDNGSMEALQQLLSATPEGVLEMMNIKGLGPKKIHTLWKEIHIASLDALAEACQQNKLASIKGFGEKTQQNILESIHFLQQNSGKYLYAQIENFAEALHQKLQQKFTSKKMALTGAYRRQLEVIESLDWVTTAGIGDLKKFFDEDAYTILAESEQHLQVSANGVLVLNFFVTTEEGFAMQLFKTTGSDQFVFCCTQLSAWDESKMYLNEADIFATLKLQYIPPFLRETEDMIHRAQENNIPDVVQLSDIKGLIHSHSNWSDGGYDIEVMAQELIKQGFEYMVLSDHSKAAFYANGLSEQKIKEQHKVIDALNIKLAPFKIFKSIECDILNDGEMDYSNEVLASFDLVIASVHSNLQMTQEKAMKRLLGAISNPYITILGHMTGRLLTKRKGYPVDHEAIIDACAKNNVVIEINASPQRLDMDWQWIDAALQKNVMLSIDPDAHTLDDFNYLKYGVLVAQKGGLTKQHNLSSMGLKEFETFLSKQKKAKGLIQ